MRANGKEWHSALSEREEEKKKEEVKIRRKQRAENKKETFREKLIQKKITDKWQCYRIGTRRNL